MDMKVCSKCKESLPATVEYFHRRNEIKSGFVSICKKCRGSSYGIHLINKVLTAKPGYKYCTQCKAELPANIEYFFKSNDSLHCKCKVCEGHEYGIKNKYIKYSSDQATRICTECGQEFPNTIEYFYKKDVPSGLTAKCKSCVVGKSKIYYDNNKLKVQSYKKIYSGDNKEKLRLWAKNYRENCNDTFKLNMHRRRARVNNCISTLTTKDWEECLVYFDYKDAYTGLPMKAISQDHVIPVSKGGGYTKQNIIPCERTINSVKGKKDMETWYRQQPFFSEERLQKIYNWIGMKDNIQQLSIL